MSIVHMTKVSATFRIEQELMDRLKKASNRGPYAPTMTQIVERGIELALKEFQKRSTGDVQKRGL